MLFSAFPHRILASALVLALATPLAGCARIRDTKGYVADSQLVAALAPGIDNRASVIRTLGHPTFESTVEPSRWYYVSRTTEQLAFLAPEPLEHKVVVVAFDAGGAVASVTQLDKAALVDVVPSGDKTSTSDKDVGIFQQLFGNIGRYAAPGAKPRQAPR